MAKSSLRIGRINNGTKYISLYSDKAEALAINTSSNKKCLCYNSPNGVLYAATNSDENSPTPFVLKFYDNGVWRYVHEYTTKKKTVYYDAKAVNPAQKPYSQYPELYSDTQRTHPATYREETGYIEHPATSHTEWYFKDIFGNKIYQSRDYNAVAAQWNYYNAISPGAYQVIQSVEVSDNNAWTESYTYQVEVTPAYTDTAIQVDVPY